MDFGFLLGFITASVLRPTLKSISTILGTYSSRIALGFYYDVQRNYPDFLNVALDIFYEDENGVLHHAIDSLVQDVHISTVYLNPFMGFLFRRSHLTTTVDNPLPDFYPIRPRPRWQKKLVHSKVVSHMRSYMACRDLPQWLRKLLCIDPPTLVDYRAKRARAWGRMLSKVVGLAGQFTTNQAAMDHAAGLPHKVVEFRVFVTYERGIPERDQHFRVVVIHKERFFGLWNASTQSSTALQPVFDNPHLAHRYKTLTTSSKICQRLPYKNAVLEHRVPLERWLIWHRKLTA